VTQRGEVPDFLHGCGLPAAWAGLPQWRILETGFGFGLNFLATWAAWRADPHRPVLLHFVATEAQPVSAADLLRAGSARPGLAPLAQELSRQWWGLLPGLHRLRFDDGHVLLTLCLGDWQAQLRQQRQQLTVDSVYLHDLPQDGRPQRHPAPAGLPGLPGLKAVAACCRRGTRLASRCSTVRDALVQCGFTLHPAPGSDAQRDMLHAVYHPHWQPRTMRPAAAPATPGECMVIGGGIAGAATAASLARRGWQLRVLDQAAAPAAGASGLPAGIFAPHVSADDNLLSRLSRSGVRSTLEQARWRLREGLDWSHCGVLEHRADASPGLPARWSDGPGADGRQSAAHAALGALAQSGLPANASVCWHPQAGWIRPARLVAALLAQPGIRWQGACRVARLRRVQAPGAGHTAWQALDAQGRVLAQAPTVVIAAGAGSLELLEHRWPLQPVRGQVSWGLHGDPAAPLLPFPVNGHGHLVPRFPLGDDAQGPCAWVMGATFERGVEQMPPAPADVQAAHASHWARLQTLLPRMAPPLESAFAAARADAGLAAPARAAQSWAAVRCTAPDRLPIVGPVDAAALPGLWVCSAMGARGLTLALLCGELLAARLQGEPLPIEHRLAKALDSGRM